MSKTFDAESEYKIKRDRSRAHELAHHDRVQKKCKHFKPHRPIKDIITDHEAHITFEELNESAEYI